MNEELACNKSEPKRRSQVMEIIDTLNSEIVSMEDFINSLISRLEPVLREPEPCTTCDEEMEKEPKSDRVPLSRMIEHIHGKAACINEAICDALRRLEL